MWTCPLIVHVVLRSRSPLTTLRFMITFLSLKMPSMSTLQQYGPLSVRRTFRMSRSICPSRTSPVSRYRSSTCSTRVRVQSLCYNAWHLHKITIKWETTVCDGVSTFVSVKLLIFNPRCRDSNRCFSKSVSKFQHVCCLQKCTWWTSHGVQLCVILSIQTNLFKMSWPWRWRRSHPSAPGCCCTRRFRSRGPSRPGSARNASRSTDRTERPRPPPAL